MWLSGTSTTSCYRHDFIIIKWKCHYKWGRLRLELDITVIVWSSSSPRFSKDPLPISRSACHLHPPCLAHLCTWLPLITVNLATIHRRLTPDCFLPCETLHYLLGLSIQTSRFSYLVCFLVIISAICPWARFKPPVSGFLFTCWMNPWFCCSCYLLLVRLSASVVVSLGPNPCFPLPSHLQLSARVGVSLCAKSFAVIGFMHHPLQQQWGEPTI